MLAIALLSHVLQLSTGIAIRPELDQIRKKSYNYKREIIALKEQNTMHTSAMEPTFNAMISYKIDRIVKIQCTSKIHCLLLTTFKMG